MNQKTAGTPANPLLFWKWPLFLQIIVGMVLGIGFGLVASQMGWQEFTANWIQPFGKIFVNSLKLIAVPLIVASLIKGIADIKDISKLSSMGGRTVGMYLFTTVVAVTIGLVAVNVIEPGKSITPELREKLVPGLNTPNATDETKDVADKSEVKAGDDAEKELSTEDKKKAAAAKKRRDEIIEAGQKQGSAGPLQALIDLVPQNLMAAASDNGNMLQVIFFTVLFGIGLILIDPSDAQPVMAFFNGVNEVILKIIDLIMLMAPIGVFALLASLITTTSDWKVFEALLMYSMTVVIGLSLMVFVVYPSLLYFMTGKTPLFFLRGIAPAQLLAFSTSSSAATLPVTMERVEEHLGVDGEVASFVLPVGATVNMDGTSLYQAVAAVFIAQALGYDLSLQQQVMIVITATMASIGSAAVPGAGMVMLVIVLTAIGIPVEGLALIIAVDRVLDMCRTVVNVTGDAAVSMIVAKSVGKLGEPHVKNWDDKFSKSDG